MAEGYGAAAIGTYDSAFLGGDAYVRATLMAMASSRAAIGLRPSNPLTREPQIMASFLASLDSLSGGRAFLDVASGDSAVFNIGYPAASRARIEDYVTCVRDLLARGEATYQGRAQRVRWAQSAVRARIPISICAEGPRMLHLGGRIGEGVIAGTGLLPEVIQDTVARIHAGAREAGRDPAGVDIWFTTRTALDTDRDTAIERVKASVSSILNHSMRFGLDGKLVPEGLREKVQEYVDGYVLYDHVLQGGQNPKRMEKLGLTDYALRRFALAGAPATGSRASKSSPAPAPPSCGWASAAATSTGSATSCACSARRSCRASRRNSCACRSPSSISRTSHPVRNSIPPGSRSPRARSSTSPSASIRSRSTWTSKRRSRRSSVASSPAGFTRWR